MHQFICEKSDDHYSKLHIAGKNSLNIFPQRNYKCPKLLRSVSSAWLNFSRVVSDGLVKPASNLITEL